jgi:hypothetical protein
MPLRLSSYGPVTVRLFSTPGLEPVSGYQVHAVASPNPDFSRLSYPWGLGPAAPGFLRREQSP